MKIALLPLYLQFYRDVCPAYDEKVAAFANTIAGKLRAMGCDLIAAPVCARCDEVKAALKQFQEGKAEAIVTLHLAYSPSLEAEELLAQAGLPIIMLDTTPDYEYPPDHSTLMTNHGIHGVQDLANRLRRRCAPYKVIAGHWSESKVLEKLLEVAKAAVVANAFRHSRVGRIGGDFKGMGDFCISAKAMQDNGIETVNFCQEKHAIMPDEAAIANEMASMKAMPITGECDEETYRINAITSLMVRNFIEQEQLGSFTFNFMDAHTSGMPTTPFMEACQAMARNIGYAGEGDVLDAAWVGAIMKSIANTTFTEMFCPDWKCGRIYISHMGEVNSALLDNAMLRKKDASFLPKPAPLVLTGSLKPGKVTIANLAPGPDDKLELITTEGELLPFQETGHQQISGLFRPGKNLSEFLPAFSQLGGTHHSAMCYDVPASFLDDLALFLGIPHHSI
ncbi:MAG: hypothetical protein IKS20_04700 [Victivallales bacterium]|nr:hypothetical protein [Victivallales bacterium]